MAASSYSGRGRSREPTLGCSPREDVQVEDAEPEHQDADGEQRRDFVYVKDLAHLNMFFAQIGPYAAKSDRDLRTYQGVVNAGSGKARTFNDVARALMSVYGEVPIEYIDFPSDLNGRYQHFTEADLTGLRALGCGLEMTTLESGIRQTCENLTQLDEPAD